MEPSARSGNGNGNLAVDEVGEGLAALDQAAEEHFVHEEGLDLVLDEAADVARPELPRVALLGQVLDQGRRGLELDLLLGELDAEIVDGLDDDALDDRRAAGC